MMRAGEHSEVAAATSHRTAQEAHAVSARHRTKRTGDSVGRAVLARRVADEHGWRDAEPRQNPALGGYGRRDGLVTSETGPALPMSWISTPHMASSGLSRSLRTNGMGTTID